ncbi:MAG: hypothetical protein ACLUDU_01315 [Butyricimonas faecihominis]
MVFLIVKVTGSWSTYYQWLANAKAMEKEAEKLGEVNYQAVSKVLQSYMFDVLFCLGMY